MRKENPINQSVIPRGISISEAYLGPWVPVSQVATKDKPLPNALRPHIHDVKGEPSVPVRLVNRLANLK